METVKESLLKREHISLRGFGNFIIKRRAEKTARNIQKNTTVIIPAHDYPSFKPAKEFVEKMKNTAGWDDVLGRDVEITGHEDGLKRICGVFKPINQGSFSLEDSFYSTRPMVVFYCDPQQYTNFFKFIFVKYHKISPEALEHTQAVVNEILPEQCSQETCTE